MKVCRPRSLLLASTLAIGAALAVGGAFAADGEITVMQSDSMDWGGTPEGLPPGAQAVVLFGDPGAEGPFAVRLKTEAAYTVPPHTHSQAENVTVIEGTMNIGHGEKLDKQAAEAVPAGGFFAIPAGHPHYAWSDGPVILQINGEGPFDIKYINPSDDPRTKTN